MDTQVLRNLARACFVAALLIRLLSVDASTISYTYDPAGRLVTANYGANNTASYAYDNAGNLLQSSQPTPGITIASVVGNQLTLSWPISPAGFVLQSAGSVSSGVQWNNVGVTPTKAGNLNVVTLTLTGNTMFYRLQK